MPDPVTAVALYVFGLLVGAALMHAYHESKDPPEK